MLVHAVYFWLKPGLKPADIASFEKFANALTSIPSVRQGWVGKPAATNRPIIDSSYSYALVVVFDDMAGHDVYQVHPIHDAFRENCEKFWSQVKIYDSI